MFAKKIIYTLKRRYGSLFRVVRLDSQTRDFQTGVVAPSYTVYSIAQMIEMPDSEHTLFNYDIAYVKAASNFTQGGFFDVKVRTLIFDKDDLDITIRLTDYLVKDGRPLRIKNIANIENQIIILTCSELSQEDTAALPLQLNEILNLGGETSGIVTP